MKNQFVTFEVAQKLKDLGFKEDCLAFYVSGQLIFGSFNEHNPEVILPAPLLQQAEEFLREKHDLEIYVANFSVSIFGGNYCNKIFGINSKGERGETKIYPKLFHSEKNFHTYQEARESAIMKAIEFIT